MTQNKKTKIHQLGLILGLILIVGSIIPYGINAKNTPVTSTSNPVITALKIPEQVNEVVNKTTKANEMGFEKITPLLSLADVSLVSGHDYPPYIQQSAAIIQIAPLPTQAVVTKPKEPTQKTPKTASSEPKEHWVEYQIQRGDNLAKIYHHFGFSSKDLYYLLHSGHKARQFSKINPKQTLRFLIDQKGRPQEINLIRSQINKMVAIRTKSNKYFNIHEKNEKLTVKIAHLTGLIRSSLFKTTEEAGLTGQQVMALVKIFASEIDFALQLHEGDKFSVIYEALYLNGKKYKNGKILAAEFDLHGRVFQALAYTDRKNNLGYYSPTGKSKQGIFLRTPLNFTRISSHFTKRRWHPTLKRWKAHRGVDYAAPTGTPVKSTAKGKVIFKGWQNGYGRVVFIQHKDKYTTVYAHLSRFKGSIKKGKKVTQGQTIGYVGQSGRATGPHLHYEFRINNKHQNPEKLKFKSTAYLAKGELKRFKKKTVSLYEDLQKLHPTVIAMSK